MSDATRVSMTDISVVPAFRNCTEYQKWACAVGRRDIRGEKWDQRYPELQLFGGVGNES